MERIVKKGNTLLVSGPASMTLIKGKVMVLGSSMRLNRKLVIRRGKTIPFEVHETSCFDIKLSEKANIDEISGSTIPNAWIKTIDEVLELPNPCIVFTLGSIDCGKTTFCTYLANKALTFHYRIIIIDADIGQSDIGPPATIGLGLVKEPIYDLFYLKAQNIFFAGITSPNTITERIIEGLTSVYRQAEEIKAHFSIINTDGWIQGEGAQEFKTSMMRSIRPNAIVGIQSSSELEPILLSAEEEGFQVYRLKPSPFVRSRSRELRKELREQNYQKFLRENVLRSIPLNWIKLEYTPLSNGTSLNINSLNLIKENIGYKVIYCEETPQELFIVLDKKEQISEENIVKMEEELKKRLYIVNDGDEEGLLVGLLDKNRQFLGLGVVSKIDYERQKMRLFTSCKDRISIVQFGQMKNSKDGKEIGVTKSFSN